MKTRTPNNRIATKTTTQATVMAAEVHEAPIDHQWQVMRDTYHPHSDDLLAFDDVFVNAYLDSSHTLSSPETWRDSSNEGFDDMHDLSSNLPPTADDQSLRLTVLEQWQPCPVEVDGDRNRHKSQLADGAQVPQHHFTSRQPYQSLEDLYIATRCSCLEQHARFFCHLKELDHNHHPAAIVITLDAAKHAQQLWQRLVSCQLCWQDEDHGALLLSVMNICTVLKRVQRFLTFHQQQGPNRSPADGTRLMFAGAGVAEAASPATASGGIDRSRCWSHNMAIPTTASPMKVAVGDFQIPEEEQMFVVGMLIIRTLGRIKEGLDELWGKIRENDLNSHRLSGFISPRLERLKRSMQEVEQSLRHFIVL
ncbi:C6 finger domain protein GliZ-like, putative [Paecilomyces variotii No. 5]|uniref:C6 finger domain protein GliZ-like, putative n=1 Tax=Byssochlamys spectabilis (strain No. 5 / NBRC 109023) TaxID=1356009 RepID=V5FKL6_BYSSN|nr:C6 finger domain protein GliZ-like, putative [Paecilomyces variotii No. 5]